MQFAWVVFSSLLQREKVARAWRVTDEVSALAPYPQTPHPPLCGPPSPAGEGIKRKEQEYKDLLLVLLLSFVYKGGAIFAFDRSNAQTVDKRDGFRQFDESFRPPFPKGGTDPTPWGVGRPPQRAKSPNRRFFLITFSLCLFLQRKSG